MSIQYENIEPPASKPGFGSFIVGGLLLAVAAGIIILTNYVVNQARESQTWPTTDGIIVESYVEENVDEDAISSYEPIIVFQYTVNGKLYAKQGHKFGLNASYGSRNGANNVLADYPIGKDVTVYYDPDDHTVAVLDRSVSQPVVWLAYGVSALFALSGLAKLLSIFRSNLQAAAAGE